MKIQEKPDYLIFAESAKKGEVSEFPDVSRGWGITIEQTGSKPPMEWMNGAFNRVDKNTLYLLQQGVPEWNENVKYPANAIIKHNGVLYTAIVENDNSNPAANTTKWKKTQAEVSKASTTQSGIVKLNSSTDSTSETEAATPKAVKSAYDLASNAVKKTGDNISGQIRFSPSSEGIKFLYENGCELAQHPSGDSFIYAFYDAKLNTWTNKLRYANNGNTWRFENVDDVTINNKSVLKVGDALPVYVGDQRLMPFRRDELPFGWYFRNGDNFLLDSPQGGALNDLSANYKRDHNITIKTINGKQYINVPTAFAPDGRGFFERAVNGGSRQVGSWEDDAIRNIIGSIGNVVVSSLNDSGAFYHSTTISPAYAGNNTGSHVVFNFDASRVVPTANENRPLNVGMTPVIYLGV